MIIGICDDSLEMMERYTNLFKGYIDEENLDVSIKSFKSGNQVLFDEEDIIKYVDVMFMDIKMPEISGFDTVKKLREHGYTGGVVFLTYSKDMVFNAFDVKAFHYIVKDTTPEKRIKEIFLNAIEDAEDKKSEYIVLSGVGERRSVPLSKISYFEIMQKLVTVYYDNKSFEFVSTMGKLETQLFNKGFLRIGRSYLVSLSHVESFAYEKVTLTTGEVLPVGRKYYKDLKTAMQG